MIRIDEIDLTLNDDISKLEPRIISILNVKKRDIEKYEVVKRAIDSRNKNNILIVYSVVVTLVVGVTAVDKGLWKRHRVREFEPFVFAPAISVNKFANRPIVVGAGPCGLFATLVLALKGLQPVLIERGSEVSKRVSDVDNFFKTGRLNVDSNVQFGEGGAGTFSDGKLNTLVNDKFIAYVFSQMVEAGAPDEILFDAKPHVGTDKLRDVVKNIREKIKSHGGEVRFDTFMTDLVISDGKITGLITSNGETIVTKNIILAPGHSARETYQMLLSRGVLLSSKPFAIGVRIEHLRKMIDESQFGKYAGNKLLGAAKYKLFEHLSSGRTVYTFCQCPGGFVVPSASEQGGVVTNGMSYFAQDGINTNSAVLVNVNPEDFGSSDPLAGVHFQRELERRAFLAGGGNFAAPVQPLKDFFANKVPEKLGIVKPTYCPDTTLYNLNNILPVFVSDSIKKGIICFDKKLRGFADAGAVITAIESRSSSAVRILRDENFESNIRGLYPAGEGAGYAGGIVSSAVDGIKAAIKLCGEDF